MICLVYFFSGYSKVVESGWGWANGSTLQYYLVFHNTEYGLWLAQYYYLCKALSIFALVLEFSFPIILVFSKLAWVVLPLGLLFHIGTAITMATPFYQLRFSYIAFVDFDALGIWLLERLRIPLDLRDL